MRVCVITRRGGCDRTCVRGSLPNVDHWSRWRSQMPYPPIPSPRRSRVHELAKELGVPAAQILADLKVMGEFVKSASSTVEVPIADRLRRLHQAGRFHAPPAEPASATTSAPGAEGRRPAPSRYVRVDSRQVPREPRRQPSLPRRRLGPRGATVDELFPDPEDAALARALGITRAQRRRDRQEPLTGLARTIRDHFEGVYDEEARRLAKSWAWLGEKGSRAWWDAGLGLHDHGQAVELARYGIQPHHADLVLDGWPVRRYLQRRVPSEWLAARLRDHGHLAEDAARA